MKIGIDCRLWSETGVGRYIRNLAKELQIIDKNNTYVLFVLSKDYEKFKVQSSKFKVRIADIRWHSIEEQLKFPSLLDKYNLDLVHFPYFSVPIFYNRPFIVTIHDLIINHFPTGQASTLWYPIYSLKLLGYKFVISQAAKKAKKIISVSNTTKEEIVDHLGIDRNKVVVTYEGVDSQIESFKNNRKWKMINGRYFLYVGNAYPHKNLERLLEAFNGLNSGVKLVLIGKEDYFYNKLKKKAEAMNLSDRIIFLQSVSDQELADLYKKAIALVVPSLMEGFGLPALEAMASRCLVLASDIPSLKETCGNAALYFNPLNIDELIEKLNMVTSHTTMHEGLEEIRKRGIERAKKFSWEKMARQTLEVYEGSIDL